MENLSFYSSETQVMALAIALITDNVSQQYYYHYSVYILYYKTKCLYKYNS